MLEFVKILGENRNFDIKITLNACFTFTKPET